MMAAVWRRPSRFMAWPADGHRRPAGVSAPLALRISVAAIATSALAMRPPRQVGLGTAIARCSRVSSSGQGGTTICCRAPCCARRRSRGRRGNAGGGFGRGKHGGVISSQATPGRASHGFSTPAAGLRTFRRRARGPDGVSDNGRHATQCASDVARPGAGLSFPATPPPHPRPGVPMNAVSAASSRCSYQLRFESLFHAGPRAGLSVRRPRPRGDGRAVGPRAPQLPVRARRGRARVRDPDGGAHAGRLTARPSALTRTQRRVRAAARGGR
jgi:hypothetical protein